MLVFQNRVKVSVGMALIRVRMTSVWIEGDENSTKHEYYLKRKECTVSVSNNNTFIPLTSLKNFDTYVLTAKTMSIVKGCGLLQNAQYSITTQWLIASFDNLTTLPLKLHLFFPLTVKISLFLLLLFLSFLWLWGVFIRIFHFWKKTAI
jgi:hypothetical protein